MGMYRVHCASRESYVKTSEESSTYVRSGGGVILRDRRGKVYKSYKLYFLYLYINLACLSVCLLFVCLFVCIH